MSQFQHYCEEFEQGKQEANLPAIPHACCNERTGNLQQTLETQLADLQPVQIPLRLHRKDGELQQRLRCSAPTGFLR